MRTTTDSNSTIQVRKISWEQLWKLRPYLRTKAANDNLSGKKDNAA